MRFSLPANNLAGSIQSAARTSIPSRFTQGVGRGALPAAGASNRSARAVYHRVFVLHRGAGRSGSGLSLSRLNWRWATGITVALLTVGLVDSWMVGPPNLRYLFHNRIEPLPRAAEFRQWFVANPGNQTEIALANMGSANCEGYGYFAIPTTVSARNNPTDISYH